MLLTYGSRIHPHPRRQECRLWGTGARCIVLGEVFVLIGYGACLRNSCGMQATNSISLIDLVMRCRF